MERTGIFSNESEDALSLEARNTEFAEGSRTSCDKHLEQPIELVGLASVAPILDVYLLPAVRSSYCISP